jgi:dTDP-4-dehydrorhamnose 3,5-epimerase
LDSIDGVVLTPLRIIKGDSGNVMHALKSIENTFAGFGEAYFSTVEKDAVKGWKKHHQMTLNLIVPAGEILFVLYDAREKSPTQDMLQEIKLSVNNYQRLTVPPGVWMAFKGLNSSVNMLLNIASIPHDPAEAENLAVDNDQVPYKFK